MTIIRAIRNSENPYVIVNKVALNDKRLTWKAKGIFCYLLSMSDNWEFYLSELEKHANNGRDCLSSGINELEKYGYIIRKRDRDKNGLFKGITWEVIESPNLSHPKTGYPGLDKPESDKPFTDNPQLISNNNIISNDSNIYTENSGSEFGFVETNELKKLNTPKEFRAIVIKHYRKQLQLYPNQITRKERLQESNIVQSTEDLYKVSKKFGYDVETIENMLEFSLTNDFWQDKTTSLLYKNLTDRWKNGEIKIDALNTQYKNSLKFNKDAKYHKQIDSKTETERIEKYGTQYMVKNL